jgi:hypothetical protein
VGIELRDAFQGAGEASVYVSILVPWKGEVREAVSTEIEDDDHGTCGDGDLPCYRNRREITFVKGADPEYNDIIVTLSGTAPKKKQKPPVAMDVNEVEHRHFFEGLIHPRVTLASEGYQMPGRSQDRKLTARPARHKID